MSIVIRETILPLAHRGNISRKSRQYDDDLFNIIPT